MNSEDIEHFYYLRKFYWTVLKEAKEREKWKQSNSKLETPQYFME